MYTKANMYMYSSSSFLFWNTNGSKLYLQFYDLIFFNLNFGNCSIWVHLELLILIVQMYYNSVIWMCYNLSEFLCFYAIMNNLVYAAVHWFASISEDKFLEVGSIPSVSSQGLQVSHRVSNEGFLFWFIALRVSKEWHHSMPYSQCLQNVLTLWKFPNGFFVCC